MKDLEEIDEKLSESSNNLSLMCKIIKIGYLILPPLFTVLVFLCTSNLDITHILNNGNYSKWYKFAFILSFFIGSSIIVFSALYYFVNREEQFFIGELNEKKTLLIKYNKFKDRHTELEEFTDFLTEYTTQNIQQINTFVIYIKSIMPKLMLEILECKADKTKFYTAIQPLFNMLYENLDYIYNNGQKHLFTIALYLYDNNEESSYKLKPYYSQKPLMMKKGRGRHWQVGDGQIGSTFQNKISYNYRNIANEINPKTLNAKEDDDIRYASALSFPILNQLGDARGVFCITSNIESAFMEDEISNEIGINSCKTKETCAQIVANIIEICLIEVFGDSNDEIFATLPKDELADINIEKINREKELNV